jgi:hypothetical protein
MSAGWRPLRLRRGRSFQALPRSGWVAPIKTTAKAKTPERLDWILPSYGCYESPPISRCGRQVQSSRAPLSSRLPDMLKKSKPCATRLLEKEVHTTTTGPVGKSGVSKAAVLASQTGRPIDRLSSYFSKYSVPRPSGQGNRDRWRPGGLRSLVAVAGRRSSPFHGADGADALQVIGQQLPSRFGGGLQSLAAVAGGRRSGETKNRPSSGKKKPTMFHPG